MTTNQFLIENKKQVFLGGCFVVLLLVCYLLEMFTTGGTNQTNDFVFQPSLFVGMLYSAGLTLCVFLPMGLMKAYKGHLLTPATTPPAPVDDLNDWKFIARVAFSIFALSLILFMLACLGDYLMGTPMIFPILLGICIIIYKVTAWVLATLAVILILMTVFSLWIAPGAGKIMGSTWGVGIIGFIALIFLLATCNRQHYVNGIQQATPPISTNVPVTPSPVAPQPVVQQPVVQQPAVVNPTMGPYVTGGIQPVQQNRPVPNSAFASTGK